MKINILRIAKGKVSWADSAVEVYVKRIQHHWKTTEQTLKLAPKGDVLRRKQQESKQIMNQLAKGDRLIVLDERGEMISTEKFATWLEQAMNQGCKRLVFAIGGPFGHDPKLRNEAWKTLALSPMILNHELARIVLAEQLYRASTILYGGKYHH